jgi:DNA polymerase III beta subunit, central domain
VAHTTKIDPRRLKALSYFAGKGDVRYYLNGICMQWLQNGRGIMTATDGHRLATMPAEAIVKGETFESPPENVTEVIMSNEVVALALKATGRDLQAITLEIDEGPVSAGSVRLRMANGATFPGFVDGKFPDWRRVIAPIPEDGTVTRAEAIRHFSASYVADFSKANTALDAGARTFGAAPMTMVALDHNSAIRVTLGRHPEFVGVLMPTRAENREGHLPEWFGQRMHTITVKQS